MRKFPDALIRLVLVIGVTALGFISIRLFVLPASLTDVEFHKKSTIEREASKEIKYAGSIICSDCHDEEPARVTQGYHYTLSCETCHGPAQGHVEDFEVKPLAPRRREFCPVCHTYDPSRPTGFPQINPVGHNPLEPCILCHDPHDPKPLETPQECAACHAEIARTKAVSHHVRLECTICHETPDEHKVTPRMVRAGMPRERGFCGQCHAEASEVQETLKVDVSSHGGRYLCWQCHYPHLPGSN